MPLTRQITCEEDVTLSISTTMTGLVTKYNINGRVGAKELLASMLANTAIGINELIEGSKMTIVEKAALRGDMKTICARAFRAPMKIVAPNGQNIANETPANLDAEDQAEAAREETPKKD